MDSNQSGAVGGIILGVFQGSLTHLGASRRLRGQKYIKARPILGHILTFFDPPCQPTQFFLVKNSLYRCPTYSTTCFMLNSGGILGPLKSDLGVFSAKIPLYPYNVKTQKTHFLKTLSWADFDLLESNSRYIFLHKNQKIYHSEFFFS